MDIRELLKKEEIEIQHVETAVSQILIDEKFLSTKLHEVEDDDDCTFGQKISDKVADLGGSWGFILSFIAFMIIWICINAFILKDKSVDPYPFILLNLILSCLAALQAPIIMMSQNRQEEKDRRRARSDFMINLKAEMEIRNLHAKLDKFQKGHDVLVAMLEAEKELNLRT